VRIVTERQHPTYGLSHVPDAASTRAPPIGCDASTETARDHVAVIALSNLSLSLIPHTHPTRLPGDPWLGAEAMSRPAWQTEELDEEWIEDDDNDSLNVTRRSGASATSTISLTEVIGSLDITDHHRRSHGSQASDRSADGGRSATAPRGTFVVREGVEAVPLMAKTPGKPKGAFAGMFTPLALEKMFEPPSPPPAGPSVLREPSPARSSPPQSAVPRHSPGPSPLSQSHLPVPPIPIVHITPSASFQFDASTHSAYPPQLEDGDTKTSQVPSTEFTFTAPRFTPIPFNPNPGRVALAESTPGPSCPQPGTKQRLDIETPLPLPSLPAPPMTDPRLRLFQFQYDTFTREHLSAILDTMPVHAGSPSTTNFSPHSAPASAVGNSVFSPIGELSLESATSIDRMRAAKRVKLSLRGESDESSTEESEASPPISARSHRTSESYGEGAGAGAHVARPKSAVQANLLQVHGQGSEEGTSRRDYVKESAAFMQQLKAHRDFSTVSTTSAMADMLDGSRIVSKGSDSYFQTYRQGAHISYQAAQLQIPRHLRVRWPSGLYQTQQRRCMQRISTVIRSTARSPPRR
jgi:hypothetical protein